MPVTTKPTPCCERLKKKKYMNKIIQVAQLN